MKNIPQPRRILVLGKPTCPLSKFVQNLTGTAPTPAAPDGSVAGSVHAHTIATKYYTAQVPLWIDEIPDVAAWRADFLLPEAREVVRAVGAWIYCFDGADEEVEAAVRAVDDVVTNAAGEGWEGAKLVVALDGAAGGALAGLEDVCLECGFEAVDAAAEGPDAFGGRQGMERVREVLETNDWDGGVVGDGTDDLEEEHDGFNEELWGMKTALLAGGEDRSEEDQVQAFESLLSSARAIKDLGPDMPLDERRRLQKAAIDRLVYEDTK